MPSAPLGFKIDSNIPLITSIVSAYPGPITTSLTAAADGAVDELGGHVEVARDVCRWGIDHGEAHVPKNTILMAASIAQTNKQTHTHTRSTHNKQQQQS